MGKHQNFVKAVAKAEADATKDPEKLAQLMLRCDPEQLSRVMELFSYANADHTFLDVDHTEKAPTTAVGCLPALDFYIEKTQEDLVKLGMAVRIKKIPRENP